MFFKKLLMASVGMVLVGTTIVETRAGVKAKEAGGVIAREGTFGSIAGGEPDRMPSGAQVIGGIAPSMVGEASVFGKDGRSNNAGESDPGYNSGLIAVTTKPPPKKKPSPKPKGK